MAKARRARLPVPTAYRLVNELQEWGALTRWAAGDYVIGRRWWDVALLAPTQTGLREMALHLDRLAGHASVPVVSRIGSRLPLHATGVGKVLLAHAPASVQAEVLSHLHRVTAHTVVHAGVLKAQLTRVHRDGYAMTVEEMTLGACSVAVPVFHEQSVVAALGLVVPTLKRDKLRLVSALHVAAQGISRSLA